jgi:hypothetical protein
MEESTRHITIGDLKNLDPFSADEAYITTHQIFEDFSIAKSLETLRLSLHNPDPTNLSDEELELVDTDELVSDQIKVLIYVQDTVYHFFIDSLAMILKIHKENPDVKFVLYLQKARYSESIDNFYKLMHIVLDGEGVDYITIPTVSGKDYTPVYRFNNYLCFDSRFDIHHVLSFLDVEYMADIVLKYSRKHMNVTDPVEPFRKLYVCRGEKSPDLGPIANDYLDYRDDVRMNDHWKIEEFFASLGYDTFRPEKQFDSIMEQIVYMSEVKTLVSITSSGLSNMIFMQPNQMVIELMAELVQVTRFDNYSFVYPDQKLHNFYSALSFMRQHTYISIPSHRDPDKVIKTLSSGALSYVV